MTLVETFKSTANRYNNNLVLVNTLWNELASVYSESGRYYHTLQHVGQMLEELTPVLHVLTDSDATLFALFYHDAVYDVLRTDNEEQSAAIARQRLLTLNAPDGKIVSCVHHIMATAAHTLSDNPDTNFFTDADLSILGTDTETYDRYSTQLRREYSIYPDTVYFPARAKVLKHFLGMKNIYKTDRFRRKYEEQARVNIAIELRSGNNF
jgi:predicted metal-dependent HD superfamily phosphohydrolase